MTDLEASLSEAPDDWQIPDDEHRAGYQLESDRHLTWAMRKLRDRQRRRLDIAAVAQYEMDRVSRWAAEQDERLARDVEFFEAIAKDYALRIRARDPRRKSVSCPYGQVTTRETSRPWEVDEGAFLLWLKANRPDLVKITEKPSLADAKRALVVKGDGVMDPNTGELVDGVTVGLSEVTASVLVDVIEHE